MLAESSTPTATIFCCGRRVATLSAGCHSISSNRAAKSVCSSHTVAPRSPAMRTEPLDRRHTKKAKPPPAARIASTISHIGHSPSSTMVTREKTACGYLNRNSNIGCLVRQIINHIVHGAPIGERRELLRVHGVIRMLPGVSEIHMMRDGHHQSSFVVVDAPPLGLETIVLEHRMRIHILQTRNLKTIVQVIYDVEDGIFVIKIHNFPVR